MSRSGLSEPIPGQSDVLIIGAGPVGLFAAFQLGLFGFRCQIVDALSRPGGQCIEYYADKPIFDIPAWPAITGQELVDRLLEQVAPFDPAIAFDSIVIGLESLADGRYSVARANAQPFMASAVIVAGGWGVIGKGTSITSPISAWGIGGDDEVVPVEPSTYQTCRPGVFSIGDNCFYPGKLRLILSGFHEAALATQAIRKIIDPSARNVVQHTSTSTALQSKLGVRS